jgi:hypothetical protein
MKRKDFMQEAKLSNTWNRIHKFKYNDKTYNIATVLWHSNPWKLVSTDDFDKISDWEDTSEVIYECYSQADLWEYMRDKVFNQ